MKRDAITFYSTYTFIFTHKKCNTPILDINHEDHLQYIICPLLMHKTYAYITAGHIDALSMENQFYIPV